MNPFTWNGILVTTAAPGDTVLPGVKYRGVSYGIPWPLGSAQIAEVSGYIGDGLYSPTVVPDIRTAWRYISACHSDGVAIRALLCATEREWPVLEPESLSAVLAVAEPLGYDYAYSTCEFSALYSDLHPPPSTELALIAARLNGYELLDQRTDLEAYIELRTRFAGENERLVETALGPIRESPLEDSGDFIAFDVYEIPIAAIKLSTRAG